MNRNVFISFNLYYVTNVFVVLNVLYVNIPVLIKLLNSIEIGYFSTLKEILRNELSIPTPDSPHFTILLKSFKNHFITKAFLFLKTLKSKDRTEVLRNFRNVYFFFFFFKNAVFTKIFESLFFSLKCSSFIPKGYIENRQ